MDTSNSIFLPHLKKNISVTFLLFHDICKIIWLSIECAVWCGFQKTTLEMIKILTKKWWFLKKFEQKMMILQQFGKNWWRIILFGPIFFKKSSFLLKILSFPVWFWKHITLMHSLIIIIVFVNHFYFYTLSF